MKDTGTHSVLKRVGRKSTCSILPIISTRGFRGGIDYKNLTLSSVGVGMSMSHFQETYRKICLVLFVTFITPSLLILIIRFYIEKYEIVIVSSTLCDIRKSSVTYEK